MEKSNKTTKEEYNALNSFFTKHPFSSQTFSKTTNYSVSLNQGKVYQSKAKDYIWPRLLKGEAMEEANKEKEELKNTFKIFENVSLRTNVDVGDLGENIHEVTKVFGDDEKFSIEKKEGQVMLIDFWATWCGPCQNPMNHNQVMLEKHAVDWGDKVRIVGLSLDDSKDAVVKRVNERNWKLVDHYFLGGWDAEHNAMKSYQFDGIPFVVLIDGQGKVVYTGHPSSIDLESTIDSLVKSPASENKNQDQSQEKADFKALTNKLYKALFEALNTESLKNVQCSLKITWSKEKTYDAKNEGQVLGFKPKKPSLVLNYHIKHEESVQELEANIYKIVDKSAFDIKVSVDNPKAAFKFSVDTLKTELNLNGLQEAVVNFSKTKYFEWATDHFEVEKEKGFSHENVIKPGKSENVEAFGKSLAKALEKEDPKKRIYLNRFQLACKLSKGDDFFPFEVEDAFSEDKVQVTHEENQVLLIDFWATWCGPCQGPMAHNQSMLEKNQEKWGNKVKIVGVSLDGSKEDVVQRVNDKNWKSVVHYFLGGNRKGIAPYGVRGIPDVCLVDQKGKIVYKGHPAKTNLEENINNLLEGKDIEEKKEEKKEEEAKEEKKLEEISRVEVKKLCKFLQEPSTAEYLKDLLKDMKYNVKLTVEVKQSVIFDQEMNVKEDKAVNPAVVIELRKCDQTKINPFLSKLYETVSDSKINEKKELIETINFSWGKECNACKKEMKPLDPQYYCHWCKLWFCRECGDKVVDETKQGNDKLLHPHNMVWINISDENGLQDIDEYKLGKNVMYTENCQSFGACCNGCSGGVGAGYRYICLSCRPGPRRPGGFIDICHTCAGVMKEKLPENESQYEKIVKTLADNDQHDIKSHLLLRVCYGNNYYNF